MEDNGKSSRLRELIDLVGVDKTRMLLYLKGGEQIYVPLPENLTEGHWLAKAIGYESALALCRSHGQSQLILPLGDEGLRHRSMELLDDAIARGSSNNQIVRTCGLSIRTVSRRRKRVTAVKDSPKMPTLFDCMRKRD
jgi:hypothetical protein